VVEYAGENAQGFYGEMSQHYFGDSVFSRGDSCLEMEDFAPDFVDVSKLEGQDVWNVCVEELVDCV
jgi:hypothetical protein